MFRLTTFNGSEFLFQVASFVIFVFLFFSVFMYKHLRCCICQCEGLCILDKKKETTLLYSEHTSLLTNKPGSNARFAKRGKEIQ